METGIGLGIGVTAFGCRHSRTRGEATELLRRANIREGLWNGRIAAVVSTCIKDREERAGIKDFMPEDNRITPSVA